MKHELKIIPTYFEAVLTGDKRFEIRDNSDRGFQKGDVVELKEVDPDLDETLRPVDGPSVDLGYTGRSVTGLITYVTNFMQTTGYVIFGFVTLEEVQLETIRIKALNLGLTLEEVETITQNFGACGLNAYDADMWSELAKRGGLGV